MSLVDTSCYGFGTMPAHARAIPCATEGRDVFGRAAAVYVSRSLARTIPIGCTTSSAIAVISGRPVASLRSGLDRDRRRNGSSKRVLNVVALEPNGALAAHLPAQS